MDTLETVPSPWLAPPHDSCEVCQSHRLATHWYGADDVPAQRQLGHGVGVSIGDPHIASAEGQRPLVGCPPRICQGRPHPYASRVLPCRRRHLAIQRCSPSKARAPGSEPTLNIVTVGMGRGVGDGVGVGLASEPQAAIAIVASARRMPWTRLGIVLVWSGRMEWKDLLSRRAALP